MSEVKAFRKFAEGEEVHHEKYGFGLVISDLGDGRVVAKFLGPDAGADKNCIVAATELQSEEDGDHALAVTPTDFEEPVVPQGQKEIEEPAQAPALATPPLN